MRIVVAGLTIAFLTACGINQTDQISNSQSSAKQDELEVVMEKPEVTEMSASVSSESNPANEAIEDLKLEESNSDIAVEPTSGNPMITDSGIQAEGGKLEEEKTMGAMEGDEKEIAKQKELEDKPAIEPKG